MARGRVAVAIELSVSERRALDELARRRRTAQGLARRARIVLLAAEGLENKTIAAELGAAPDTVGVWRRRFAERRLEGLHDEPRPGTPRRISDDAVAETIRRTLEETPADATHWSLRSMARSTGYAPSTIHRIWRAFGLQPHRSKSFKLSSDPFFVEKVRDIVGLYLNPPERALVLCVDEKSQIQALDRTQPLLPMRPGQAERRSHDYKRHGTLSLFAALDTATGQVIGRCFARHRAREFRAFLNTVEARGAGRSRCAHNHGQPGDPQDQGDPRLVRPPPPMAGPLHADLGLLDQPGRTFLRPVDRKAAAPRRPPLHQGARSRHPSLYGHRQCRSKAIPLDQISRRHLGLNQAFLPRKHSYRRAPTTNHANFRIRTLGSVEI